MLYEVITLIKQKGTVLEIRFGKAIPWQELKKDHSAEEWAQKIKEQTYALAKLD